MNNLHKDRHTFRQLLEAVLDDSLTDEQRATFNQLLRQHAELRTEYREHLALHAAMVSHGQLALAVTAALEQGDAPQANTSLAPPPVAAPSLLRRAARRFSPQVLGSTAVIALLCYGTFGLLVWLMSEYRLPVAQVDHAGHQHVAKLDAPAGDSTIAHVTAAEGCELHVDGKAVAPHAPVAVPAEGQLQLLTGQARLEYTSGAVVSLQGPARFTVKAHGHGLLTQGQLVALVPRRAVGFTIDTPQTRIVDLGTEFGVQVDDRGATELHVFQGCVVTRPHAGSGRGQSLQLQAGQAVQYEPASADAQRMAADRTGFRNLISGERSFTFLGLYPLDGDANDASGNGRHAKAVSEVRFTAGREGQAAEFAGNANSFIDLPIDVNATSVPDLTWGAWVKPGKGVVSRSEILSTDDQNFDRVLTIDNRQGLKETGTFRFAALGGAELGALASTGPLPQEGRWTFVAAVYRDDSRTLAVYVEDPELANGAGGLVADYAGNVEIGPSHQGIRMGGHFHGYESFAGAIDNVFVVQGALGHAQLEEIRRHGMKRLLQWATAERNRPGPSPQ